MKVYIAFSIPGTNCFISASKEVESVAVLGEKFSEVPSRRPGYDKAEGVKVHYTPLMTNAGQPRRRARQILVGFKELESQGWVLDQENYQNFLKTHGLKAK